MSREVHLIVVGRLKDKNLETIEQSYLKRVNNPLLRIHEVKAKAENKDLEAVEVIKKIKDISKDQTPYTILLSEFGNEYESPDLSKWLFSRLEVHKVVIFVIAGAEGHGDELLSFSKEKLSLSKLTFPHKIARILFVEQFYRALTIKNGHPYHN